MNFVNPLLLIAGLACLAIPVLVHLQRRRQPKRVVFSTLRLMQPSQKTTRKKRRITDWPLFLLRCLAIIFLAVVFSKFFLEGWSDGPQPQREAIALIVDRSASMNAQGEVGSVQQEAIDAAIRAIEETGQGSQIGVIVSPPINGEDAIRWSRPADAKRLLRSIEPSFEPSDLSAEIKRAARSLERFGADYPRIIHLVSDLQLAAIDDLDSLVLPPDVSIRVSKVGDLEPDNGGFQVGVHGQDVLRSGRYSFSSASVESVSVTDRPFFAQRPQERGEESSDAQTSQVVREISLADSTSALSTSALSTSALSVPYTTGTDSGWFSRTLETETDDAWSDDDKGYDAFYIQKPLPVVLIEPKPTAETFLQKTFFISRALSPENFKEEIAIRFQIQPTSLDESANVLQKLNKLSTRALVVLPDVLELSEDTTIALKDLVRSGAGLILLGGPNAHPDFYNDSLGDLLPIELAADEEVASSLSLAAVSAQHPIWGELSLTLRRQIRKLPLTSRHQAILKSDATSLATFADRVPLIAERQYGQGNVIFVNASADRSWGDWQTDGILFVVTMHLLAARAAEQDEDLWRNATSQGTVGAHLSVQLASSYGRRDLQFNNQTVTTDDESIVVLQLPSTPGLYPLVDDQRRTLRLIAVNLPPGESDLGSVQAVVVQRQLEKLRANPEQIDPSFLKSDSATQGSLFWKIALILLALLLAAETLISNRFTSENVTSTPKSN